MIKEIVKLASELRRNDVIRLADLGVYVAIDSISPVTDSDMMNIHFHWKNGKQRTLTVHRCAEIVTFD